MSRDPKDLIRLSEAEADRLARLYMAAEREILILLDRAMARGNDLRYLRSMLDNVQAILEDLFTGNRQWCEQAIPRVYIEAARFADELVGKAVGGFGAVHQQAVKVLADNTFERLESVRQVIGRRSEDLYRQYALETTRQSIIGYKTWQQVARDFRDRLRAEGITGFTDARGREWNMKTYAEMVARTTTMEAHLTGTANRLLEHGYDLVVVSSHAGSCAKCAPWQGRVLSLTGKTPGYPTLEEAREAGLFHPNCRHTYSLHIDLGKEIELLEAESPDLSNTIEQAERQIKKTLGLRNVNYEGLSVDMANEINRAVIEFVNKHPSLKGKLEYVGTMQGGNAIWAKSHPMDGPLFDENALAEAVPWKGCRGIGINQKYMKDVATFQKWTKASAESGWHPVGCNTIKSTIDHELGHQLEMEYVRKSGLSATEIDKADLYTLLTRTPRSTIEADLSRYAAKNRSEAIAEAVSEYHNNPQCRPLATQIVGLLMKGLGEEQ